MVPQKNHRRYTEITKDYVGLFWAAPMPYARFFTSLGCRFTGLGFTDFAGWMQKGLQTCGVVKILVPSWASQITRAIYS